MTILITGGAGYIGSHIAVELLNSGFGVVAVDNFSNSRRDVPGRIESITGKKLPLYDIDLRDTEALRNVFSAHAIDAVIHLAGFKAVGESVSLPLKYYRNNLDSTMSLLEIMAEFGVARFIFSSSATVYGIPDTVPLTEEAPTGSCLNPYGRTKHIIEEMLMDVSASLPDFSAVLLRYFNPIGAHESGLLGDDPDGIPNNLMPFITQVAGGKLSKLGIFGNDWPTRDGTGVRDYIHVADLAKGHMAAIAYAVEHTGCESFNLGTGAGYSVLDIVYAFERANGLDIPYEIAPRRAGDIAEYWSDASKAERLLGWRAEKTLEDMCRDAWRWQQYSSQIK